MAENRFKCFLYIQNKYCLPVWKDRFEFRQISILLGGWQETKGLNLYTSNSIGCEASEHSKYDLKSVASSGSINDFIFIAATSNNNDDILLPTLAIYILNYSCRLWQSYLSIYYCQHRQYIFWLIYADYGNLIYWSIIGGFGVLPHCIECIRVLWNKEHIGHIRHVEYNRNVGDRRLEKYIIYRILTSI